MIHPDDRDNAVASYRDATAADLDYDFEYRAVAADGRVVWVHDKVFVVRGGDGNVEHRAGLMVDITDRKLAEEERNQLLVREQAAR